MVEGAGFVMGFINKILEIFQQKAFVYIEVSFGAEKPFCLTVVNKSTFDIILKNLIATPDGFPDTNNGYLLSESELFKSKKLKPGQKIKYYAKTNEIHGKRKFTIKYSTLLKNTEIPRLEQSCEYDFDSETHKMRVISSLSTAYKINNYKET